MCALANVFEILPLKALAIDEFQECVSSWSGDFGTDHIEGIAELANLADEQHDRNRDFVRQFSARFSTAASSLGLLLQLRSSFR